MKINHENTCLKMIAMLKLRLEKVDRIYKRIK